MEKKTEKKTYQVTVEETVTETFEVMATSKEEALRIAEDKYKNCEFVLAPGNVTDVRFLILKDE